VQEEGLQTLPDKAWPTTQAVQVVALVEQAEQGEVQAGQVAPLR
jgi:flagellar biosynthesis regulator FlaF